jgi:high-affinity nickel permease
MILPYILFFLAGLAFGYAIESQLAWIVLVIPLLFALGAALSQGVDGEMVVKVLLALGLTAVAVVAGRAIGGGWSSQGTAEGSP